jgi:YVTN family beta-propeller protein
MHSSRDHIMRHTMPRKMRQVLALVLGWGGVLGLWSWAQAAPFAYVNSSNGSVSVIDTATQTVTATVQAVTNPCCGGFGGVAVHPAGTRVFVANPGDQSISVLETATNTVATRVLVGDVAGVAVHPAGTRVYATLHSGSAVSVIDTATNTVIATVPVGRGPTGVAVHPDGQKIYVANGDDQSVSVIQTVTNTVIATVPVGVFPIGVAVHPAGTRVYVANHSGSMSVIDTATNTVITTVPMQGEPVGVAVTPNGREVYVGNFVSDTVSVVDTATNMVTATVPLGDVAVWGVAVTPNGQEVYVATNRQRVVVLDTATHTPIATIPVLGPFGAATLGQFIGPDTSGLSVSAIWPTKGGDTGKVTAFLYGRAFADGTTVQLVRAGEPEIVGNSVQIGQFRDTLATTFDLTGKARGVWDVVVMNPDGTSVTIPGGFTIEEGRAPQIWVDIVGRSQVRLGREATFDVLYGNRGNIDTFDVILLLSLPAELEFNVNLLPPNVPGIDWQQVPNGGLVGSRRVIPIWIYSIPALSTQAFRFTFRAPLIEGEKVQVSAELWQAALNQFRHTGDFAFIKESSIFNTLEVLYSIAQSKIGSNAILVEDYVNALPSWLEENQDQIRIIPTCFLSVGATAGVLGTQIPVEAFYFLCDPWGTPVAGPSDSPALNSSATTRLSISIPPLFQYMNWCGQYDNSAIGGGKNDGNRKTKDDAGNLVDIAPVNLLDAGCKEHDNCVGPLGQGGIFVLIKRLVCVSSPEQNRCDAALCMAAQTFQVTEPDHWYNKEEYDRIFEMRHIYDAHVANQGSIKKVFCPASQGGVGPEKRTNGAPHGPNGSANSSVTVIAAVDPNDKVGSQGAGTPRYLSGEEPLRYAIFFENVETATAPAQEVIITDQLDQARMDLSTLSLGLITFGNQQVIPPPGLSTFTTTVDLRPAKHLIVRIAADLNPATGLLTWHFTSIDPDTGLPPDDPQEGFLPPNKNPPEGEGSVLFTVLPKQGLATGTEIRNRATIVFDVNPPINTPEWFNTLDDMKPTSHVLPLAPTQNSPSFQVQWSGTDVGSGILDYTIFVSENGGAFTTFLRNTTMTSATFTGQAGKSYAFYSLARDQTGNLEDAKAAPEATTRVVGDTTPPVITVSANPATLWPPNGKMVPVTISGTITDADSGVNASTAAYVVTDEYGLVQPREPVTLGSNGSYAFTVSLEASRRGNDQDGRHYTITVSAKDNAGNPGAASTIVTVPHDQGK